MNETIDVLLHRRDGSVTAMLYVTKDVQRTYDQSPAAIEAHIQKHFPDTLEWRVVEPGETFTFAESYQDPYFGAWSYGRTITHDMAKARNIYRERVRLERAPLLAALDVDYQRADEADDVTEKRRVGAAKQRLRDAPSDPRIESCQTVGELHTLDVLTDSSRSARANTSGSG